MSASAEAVVYALLSASSAVAAVASTRIYPVAAPEAVNAPSVVYSLVSTYRPPAIDAQAATHLASSRVQVDLLAPQLPQVRALRAAVVAALQFQRGAIAGATVHSITHAGDGPRTYDPALGLYHGTVDFVVSHEDA